MIEKLTVKLNLEITLYTKYLQANYWIDRKERTPKMDLGASALQNIFFVCFCETSA